MNTAADFLEVRDDPPWQLPETAEKKLAGAMVEQAWEEYQEYGLSSNREGTRLFNEAREWIFSDERDYSHSFVNLCEVLGMNVDGVRGKLEKVC
jgi:hypothetical protein